MADLTDRRADTTRQQILRAAAHQFAQRAYHDVGLDDILAEAELTKGAMYFHFRSKHALALAVIEEQVAAAGAAAKALVDRNLSGLETLIDIGYLMAVEDITEDAARAVLHLLPLVGRVAGWQNGVLAEAIVALTMVVERGVTEGDILPRCEPHDIAQLLMSMYLGLRQAVNLDEPEKFLTQLGRNWAILLPGMVPEARVGYFSQFIRRRTALAIRTAAERMPSASPGDQAV